MTQVVDRVTSLVSQGPGTHRITLNLHPHDLGQVRVVLSVRDGAVQVRLAAGQPETHRALLDGSADLDRLLAATGATETKVTIRELGGAAPAANGQQHASQGQQHSASGQPGHPSTDSGAGGSAGRSHDQHAGTRAHHSATDGASTPGRASAPGATGSRSSESVTTSRTTGLDVTM